MASPNTIVLDLQPRTGWLSWPGRSFTFIRRWPVIPVVVLSVLVFSAVFAGQIAPHDPRKQSLRDRNGPPFWLEGGTTNFLLANGSSLLLKQNLGHSTMAMVDHYVHLASLQALDVSRVFSPMDRLKAGKPAPKPRGSGGPFNP